LAFSAGVSGNVSNATTLGTGATNMAVNGGTTNENTYLQDGVAINNYEAVTGVSEGQQFGSFAMPSPDAIAEFKIQTSSYDASYGRNPGANVNVVTKSGTNNFHGDVYEFFRNTALNANDWFLNREGISKPALNSNIYGGTIGGPIKKDKLFFFVSYEENDQICRLQPIQRRSGSNSRQCCWKSWHLRTGAVVHDCVVRYDRGRFRKAVGAEYVRPCTKKRHSNNSMPIGGHGRSKWFVWHESYRD
jgi:hypothetical protein